MPDEHKSKKEAAVAQDRRLNPGDEAAPGTPGAGEDICPKCGGTGKLAANRCPDCGGTGKIIEGIGGA